MGIEVQIEISMGYIAIWENLTQKMGFEPNMTLRE